MSGELKTDKVQYGEPSNAHPSNFTEGVAVGEASDDADLSMLGPRAMSSATRSRKTVSTRHFAVDEGHSSPNDFHGRGITWAIMSPALCTVIGLTFAYYYTGNFLFALVSATILRAISLCAAMVPALLSKDGFRLERRRTFTFLCILSLISVLVAWALWHKGAPRWPQVLITISDVFLAVAGAQLAISSAHEFARMHQDGVFGDEHRLADLEAQHTRFSREGSGSHL
ncbi:uncharacterized protein PAC_06408 [Phialocephala subalpina]|uniref:Uncharacterized protein n=1 Tax=Phialocephala subalpina TaxID=576137 RepID=A0A1L7WUS1_9HELO|nr:uncharacterized protein PAC_06408 [Phialocephala subalpina]